MYRLECVAVDESRMKDDNHYAGEALASGADSKQGLDLESAANCNNTVTR